jgi:hypothetical protein
MTGNLTVGNTSYYPCVIDTNGYYKIMAVPTTGGWDRGFSIDSPTKVLVRFGAYGTG